MVNCVIITKGGSECVKLLFPNDGVELVRTNPVPEHPPGHCDHPHPDHHHHHDVINKITTKLTAAARRIKPTKLIVLDEAHELVERYSDQEQEGYPHPTKDQEPGHIGFSRAVWVVFSRSSSF